MQDNISPNGSEGAEDIEIAHSHRNAGPSMASPSNGGPAWLLPASILLAAVIIAGAIIYLVHSGGGTATPGTDGTDDTSQDLPSPTVSDRDVLLGNADAPVSIIEYGDYQCPFCSEFFVDTEPTLRAQYIQTGKAKMVFRNFSFLGPESDAAAAAAECAKDQQHFWEYHDALYSAEHKDANENNGNLNRALFMKLATDLKLDTAAFGKCIDSGTYATKAQTDTDDAQQYGVQSTPTVFINEEKIEGALPTSQFTTLIDSFLK
jgi:protein-disulfide isomerase